MSDAEEFLLLEKTSKLRLLKKQSAVPLCLSILRNCLAETASRLQLDVSQEFGFV
jgi:hypothetical protein